MSSESLLGLAIPTYNRCEKLGTLLQKLDGIFPPSVPFSICNDGSRDETAAVLDRFAARSVRAVIVRTHAPNKGVDQAINTAVTNCPAKYVWIVSDDDDLVDNAEQSILRYLSDRDNVGVIFCNYSVWTNDLSRDLSGPVFDSHRETWGNPGTPLIEEVAEVLSFISCLIINREKYLNEMKTLPEHFKGSHVDHFWGICCLLVKNAGLRTAEPLIKCRSGDEDRTWDGFKFLLAQADMLDERLSSPPLRPCRERAKRQLLRRSYLMKARAGRTVRFASWRSRFLLLKDLIPRFWRIPELYTAFFPLLLTPTFLIGTARQCKAALKGKHS